MRRQFDSVSDIAVKISCSVVKEDNLIAGFGEISLQAFRKKLSFENFEIVLSEVLRAAKEDVFRF